jgi:hypothetical protein
LHPGIFFGFSLFFGIFLLAGNGAHMFMLYVFGLTSMGTSLLLTGLTIHKKAEPINKSFQTDNSIPTIILTGIFLFLGIGMLVSSSVYWRDIPIYLGEDFEVLSGKPSSVEERNTSKTGATDTYVTIKDKEMKLFEHGPKYKYQKPEILKKKHFTFYYLPHSEWIVSYKID